MKVKVEVSARHVHLCDKDVEILFGEKYVLNLKRNLSQPGQFLSEEKVAIKCGNNIIEHVSVLGPTREESQVEISMTDSRKLKVDVPIRESGDLKNSPGCILVGPKGEVSLTSGLIIAKRHIHANPNDDISKVFKNGEECSLKIETENRSLVFNQTVVRISNNFKFVAHIDTDEANSAGIIGTIFGYVI